MDDETIILSAYREAALAAREKGLVGAGVQKAVLQATAKVATRLAGRVVTVDEVERTVRDATARNGS